ncbi:GNAT family N-acetyltransferase [Peptoniphilus phoceensis]|uniref:GNAT family N-acetyltransferase n=1 Tax=Peptoniphilus phoceensis TaxID=1720298 RepID=UPI0007844834|nr:GNAT family N-acetyltransferase [Peptoniphilus phoceensis]
MEFRLAREIDRIEIEKIYEDGSLKLKSLGINQWQGQDKPNLDNFKNLIANKNIFVLEDNNRVVSTVIIYDYDLDYEKNLDGKWNSPKAYVALHRIGTLGSEVKKGYGRKVIELAESYARENNFKSVRIDTHRGNKTMQGLLKSLNYKYVGLVYLSGRNERLAFEKIL